MSPIITKLYLGSPWFIKNILVSLYGALLYRTRYDPRYRDFERELTETEDLSVEEMKAYQDRKFREIGRRAIAEVPFYRDWATANGVKENDIVGIESLKLFPVLEKSDIRKNPDQFISDKYKKNNLIALSTSGSTGEPLKIYCDSVARTKHYAFFTRLRRWYGVGRRDGRVTLFGRVVVPSKRTRPPFWTYDWPQNNLIMSTYHLSDENLKFYIEKIDKFKPKEIIGHPSSIYRISKYIIDNDLSCHAPNVVVTTAETLLPYQAEAIKTAFSCPLVDQYGCTEMAFFAATCKNGVKHFHPEHAIVEICRPDGSVINTGGTGEVVATSLINHSMPLIRYKVGDSLALAEQGESCHPAFPVIAYLEGRTDDVIYTKDGRSVGRLSPIFRSDKNIESAQVVQDENGDISVFVVPLKSYSSSNRKMILDETVNRVGASINVKIIEVDSLSLEPNGKFRPVKSFFNPGNR